MNVKEEMSELRIRNVRKFVIHSFRSFAKLIGRSKETESKAVPNDKAMHRKETRANELKSMNEELMDKYGLLPDSAEYIREDRDNRG